jgi:ectoine hydroxylase-related dioxygenase (phytanoyl-CoA dioxygenase family)
MKTSITPEQITKYQEDGFLYYPQLLSAEEVATLKGAVLDAVKSMGKKKVSGNAMDEMEDKDDYYTKVFTQRLNLWKINSTVKSFMLNPELGKLMASLEGVEGYRVWHDQALIKEPWGNPTAWHLDNPYWSFHSKRAISIWIALEDATYQNGCMYFIPGTQKLATFENVNIAQDLGGLFKVYPKMAETPTVSVPMKAGDCSFHNGICAHGAGANMTNGRRIAMTCAYMPIGSTFNGQRNILPKDYFESLKPGELLENDEQNPVVYSSKELVAA